jgi:membrane dipeptidase
MYADAHCDTITSCLDSGQSLWENGGHLDVKRLKEGGCVLQFFALWADPKYEPYMAFPRCVAAVDRFYQELEVNRAYLHLISTGEDVAKAARENKTGALLSIEGGSAIGGSLANLRMLHKLGVRAMTLTWNGRNELADGVGEGEFGGGLSQFGRQVVAEMERLHMIVDVSHLNEKGFWQVAELCKGPFIASHSNAMRVCVHPRNLTDEQIGCIVRRKGFIGINFCPDFLRGPKADVEDIARHVEYICSLGGKDVLGFGGDFDGVDQLPAGVRGAQDMERVVNRLGQLGYPDDTLRGICYGNLQRAVAQILAG